MKNSMLLKAKISPPNYVKQLVWRDRLITKNPMDLLFSTNLFIAPAGYGKSTVLYQNYQHAKQKLSCAWLNLDERDNNALTLLQYLMIACSTVLNTELELAIDDHEASETLLKQLIHHIESLEQPLVLFMDDIHYLTQNDALSLLKTLFNNVSPYLGLVVAGRAYPKISLSRLKLNQKLTEYSLNELSLNPIETKKLFKIFSNTKLNNAQFQTMQQKTEGWAASIQLLAVATNDYAADTLFNNLNSPTLDITGYLEEIVLQKQPSELQEFLLKTSILDRFTVDLCEYVSGNKQASQLLETIKSKQLFIISLDANGQWYRYHHLFQSYLQEQLKKKDLQTYQHCFQLASEWYEQHHLIIEAIEYPLKVKLFHRVVNLLDKYDIYHLQNKNITKEYSYYAYYPPALFVNFIKKLPAVYLLDKPLLRLKFIKHLILIYDHEETKKQLHQIEIWINKCTTNQKNKQKDKNDLLAQVLAQKNIIHCVMLLCKDQIGELFQVCQKQLKQNTNISDEQRIHYEGSLAFTAPFIGNFKQAYRSITNIYHIAQNSNNLNYFIYYHRKNITLLLIEGKALLAHKFLNKTLDDVSHFDHIDGYKQILHVMKIETNRQLGKIDFDLSQFLLLMNITKKAYQGVYAFSCFFATLSKYLWLQGQHDKALDKLKQNESYTLLARGLSLGKSLISNEVIRQLLSIRKIKEALSEKKQLIKSVEKYPNNDKVAAQHIQENLDMIDIRLYLYEKKYQQALNLLLPLIKQVAAQGHNSRLLQLFIMQAWAYQLINEKKMAIKSLEQAFDISIPNGVIMVFIEEGYAIKSLIRKCIAKKANQDKSNKTTAYQQTLYKVLDIDPIKQYSEVNEIIQLKPLTAREMEILRYLDSLDSLKTIADKTQLKYITIRWHSKNIYRKLSTYRRADTVEKAKKLKLI